MVGRYTPGAEGETLKGEVTMADRSYGSKKIEGPTPVSKAKGADTITPTEQGTWAGKTKSSDNKVGGGHKK